ncbi:MAG: 50S ribosomal protein L15 [bacterium]
MGLHNLSPKPGSTHSKKRLGKGGGSGHGQTCTRGQKGQNSTSGGSKPDGFEGGQMPLLRRIPKSGFNNARFRTVYEIVNVGVLAGRFAAGAEVTPGELRIKKIIRGSGPVKVLGDGELKHSLKVSAHSFSKSAKEKIEKSGGTAIMLAGKEESKG